MELLDCLMKAGFTRHESILYLTLCKEGALSGYEAAKISGIPRSNAYLGLAGLVDKGGAFRSDSEVVKYTAVPAIELTSNLRRILEAVFTVIENNIPERDFGQDPYITLQGRLHIINKMKNMIEQAQDRIYLSLSSSELPLVEDEIRTARDQGKKVVIITDPPYRLEGVTVYHNNKAAGQIRLITDTSNVLTGELPDTGDAACLFSKNKNLVQLIKDSLTNEMALIRMKTQDYSLPL